MTWLVVYLVGGLLVALYYLVWGLYEDFVLHRVDSKFGPNHRSAFFWLLVGSFAIPVVNFFWIYVLILELKLKAFGKT